MPACTLHMPALCPARVQVDVLVVFDRSRSIFESTDITGQHTGAKDWQTMLKFFQQLVTSTRVSEKHVNFALATFSEDLRIHLSFNTSFDSSDIVSVAEFPACHPNCGTKSVWIPHNVIGGLSLTEGGMKFGFTNYGLVVDAVEQVYENPAHGARAGAAPLIFLVTDGSMADQDDEIYSQNGCQVYNGLQCGYHLASGFTNAFEEGCKACWRSNLAGRLANVRVKDNINVIGIGNPQSTTNKPDDRTWAVFAQGDASKIIRQYNRARLVAVLNSKPHQCVCVCVCVSGRRGCYNENTLLDQTTALLS